jgi:conserved oligomeric Golgi complex subunit 3
VPFFAHIKTKMVQLTEEMKAKLDYFLELEHIVRALNNPSKDFVLGEQFVNMLSTMDRAIAFLGSHTEYRDSEIYRMKYRQCMIRALGMIKSFVVDTLKSTMDDIKLKMTGGKIANMNENVRDALLYAKFRAVAAKVRPLNHEMDRRASRDKSYFGLLKDCLSSYFLARYFLLAPWVHTELERYNKIEDLVVTVSCAESHKEAQAGILILYRRYGMAPPF